MLMTKAMKKAIDEAYERGYELGYAEKAHIAKGMRLERKNSLQSSMKMKSVDLAKFMNGLISLVQKMLWLNMELQRQKILKKK